MAMTGIEKRFVNREIKGKHNFKKVQQQLEILGITDINEILELGCGIGTVSAYLAANYNVNVYGTDFDSEQINIARKMYPENERLHYGVEDATNLSCEDNYFDLVISQNVFHHIPRWEKAVLQICRVLKPPRYLFWIDITFPGFLIRLSKPFVKNYGLLTTMYNLINLCIALTCFK